MRDLFQRGGRSSTGPARLTLGAFGKHPGWDDHILGIGAETETLTRVRQVVYVEGIGGQVDAGAWEKLESEKRQPGFDHTFLWFRAAHVILGRLWSSTDGKGRAKYPMVLCVDAEGVSPRFLLDKVLPGLKRLQQACKATASAEQVKGDCRAAQEQLRLLLTGGAEESTSTEVIGNVRKQFLARPELGPDQQGLLRVLHELGSAAPLNNAAGRASPLAGGVRRQSHHLRVPLAADSRPDALLRWAEFFSCALPVSVPLLVIVRGGAQWLDAVLGEPAGDDLFCLQASPKALPLTTDIPYQLAPDLRQRLQELTKSLLGRESAGPVPASIAAAPALAPAAPVTVLPAPQAPPARLAPPEPSSQAPPQAKGCRKAPIVVGVVLLAILSAGGVWYSGAWRFLTSRENAAAKPQPPDTTSPTEHAYLDAVAAAQEALQSKAYSNGIAQAELALKSKPGDPEATKLLADLRQGFDAALLTAQREQQYQKATNAAALALAQMNYTEATNHATSALALKPGDPIASRLLADGQRGIESAATLAKQQQYQAATNAAGLALSQRNFAEVTNQAGIALGIKPGDSVAGRLMRIGQQSLDAAALAAQQEQQYANATNAAGLALSRGNYQEATNQAAIALRIKPGDLVAAGLRRSAEAGLDLHVAQAAFDAGDYQTASGLCKQHAEAASFTALARSIDLEQKALADASQSFAAGDYSFIETIGAQAYSSKRPFTALLQKAGAERLVLQELQALQKTNAWQQVKARLSEPGMADLAAKQPFNDLRKWAESQPAADSGSQDEQLRRLDTKLEVLLVQFGVLKATAPELRTDAARQTKPIPSGSLDNAQYYLNLVSSLRSDYEKGGWLDQNNRARNLDSLTRAINLR